AQGVREYDGVIFAHPDDFLGLLNFVVDQIESMDLPDLPVGAAPSEHAAQPLQVPAVYHAFLNDLLERKLGEPQR
ncbi:MAG TPA: hypothetical protein VMW65_18630, partial [Chloroflexota bacterium]|nr:hypothetical protein [Chloroflexota bacterium]